MHFSSLVLSPSATERRQICGDFLFVFVSCSPKHNDVALAYFFCIHTLAYGTYIVAFGICRAIVSQKHALMMTVSINFPSGIFASYRTLAYLANFVAAGIFVQKYKAR